MACHDNTIQISIYLSSSDALIISISFLLIISCIVMTSGLKQKLKMKWNKTVIVIIFLALQNPVCDGKKGERIQIVAVRKQSLTESLIWSSIHELCLKSN